MFSRDLDKQRIKNLEVSFAQRMRDLKKLEADRDAIYKKLKVQTEGDKKSFYTASGSIFRDKVTGLLKHYTSYHPLELDAMQRRNAYAATKEDMKAVDVEGALLGRDGMRYVFSPGYVINVIATWDQTLTTFRDTIQRKDDAKEALGHAVVDSTYLVERILKTEEDALGLRDPIVYKDTGA